MGFLRKLWSFVFPFKEGDHDEQSASWQAEAGPLYTLMVVFHTPGVSVPRSEIIPLDPFGPTVNLKEMLSALFNIPVSCIQLSSCEGPLKDDMSLYDQNVRHDNMLMVTDTRNL